MFDFTIVGFGPRGLYALECLMDSLSRKRKSKDYRILIIEKQQELGAGSAWHTSQPEANWINISDRALNELPGREALHFQDCFITKFPSFIEWTAQRLGHQLSDEKDTYFHRNIMGQYLNERATSLIKPLADKDWFQLEHSHLTNFEINDGLIHLSNNTESFTTKHTLLTVGHLSTHSGDEDLAFETHDLNSSAVYVDSPYSDKAYQHYKIAESIAIKGMGLTMIDAVMNSVSRLEGKYVPKKNDIFLNFKTSSKSKLEIFPYSLDGHPPVPKPLGKIVDQQFTPQKSQIDKLNKNLISLAKDDQVKTVDELLKPIASLIGELFLIQREDLNTNDLDKIILKWLQDPSFKHDLILDTGLDITDYISQTCLMAYGTQPASLDYHTGQVWRNLQPTLYAVFSHSALSRNLMSEFISIDEKTKRYSYGPPVERMLQFIALGESPYLNLNLIANPTIKENEKGWLFSLKENSVQITTLINSVLANPTLEDIDDLLLSQLRDENHVEPFNSKLGVVTNSVALVAKDGNPAQQLSVLGRIAKGSEYGVDAILECFGNRTLKWAQQFED